MSTIPPTVSIVLPANGKIYMAVANQKLFTDTCKAMGHPEWATDPRFAVLADRVANKPELTRLMEEVLKTDTKENWAHKLRHLPAGPIRTMKEALDEPEVKRRGMLKTALGCGLPDQVIQKRPADLRQFGLDIPLLRVRLEQPDRPHVRPRKPRHRSHACCRKA